MLEQIELEDAIKEAESIIKTDTILNIIDKATLGGYLEKMLFIVNNNKIEIKTNDSYQTVYSIVYSDNFLNINKDFGIYNSKQFINLIKLFDKEMKVEFIETNNELDSMLLKKDSIEVQVNLADPVMFNRENVNKAFIKENKLPKEYEIFINIDSDIVSKLIKIFDTFADSKICFFHVKKEKLYITIGDEKTRENSASILLKEKNDGYSLFSEKISFLISDFKRVLKINKNGKINIKVSSSGIMIINVIIDNIICKYYIMAVS